MRSFETVHAEESDYVEFPNYRVNFWQKGTGWALDAHVLLGVQDLHEVLTWVEEHSRGRRFEVFVETVLEAESDFGVPRTAGLVRLLGSNPNVPGGKTMDWLMIKD
jgi:hypothetical protein